MEVKVSELIAALKKFPGDACVGIQDHDASDCELSAHVVGVRAFDPLRSEVNGQITSQSLAWATGVTVVILAG